MHGLNFKTIGHHIAIAKKNKKYYLIDANVGVYEFNSLDKVKDFFKFFLKEGRYTHYFSEFNFINIPQIEEKFNFPKNILKNVKKPLKKVYSDVDFIKDKINEIYTGISLLGYQYLSGNYLGNFVKNKIITLAKKEKINWRNKHSLLAGVSLIETLYYTKVNKRASKPFVAGFGMGLVPSVPDIYGIVKNNENEVKKYFPTKNKLK